MEEIPAKAGTPIQTLPASASTSTSQPREKASSVPKEVVSPTHDREGGRGEGGRERERERERERTPSESGNEPPLKRARVSGSGGNAASADPSAVSEPATQVVASVRSEDGVAVSGWQPSAGTQAREAALANFVREQPAEHIAADIDPSEMKQIILEKDYQWGRVCQILKQTFKTMSHERVGHEKSVRDTREKLSRDTEGTERRLKDAELRVSDLQAKLEKSDREIVVLRRLVDDERRDKAEAWDVASQARRTIQAENEKMRDLQRQIHLLRNLLGQSENPQIGEAEAPALSEDALAAISQQQQQQPQQLVPQQQQPAHVLYPTHDPNAQQSPARQQSGAGTSGGHQYVQYQTMPPPHGGAVHAGHLPVAGHPVMHPHPAQQQQQQQQQLHHQHQHQHQHAQHHHPQHTMYQTYDQHRI